MSTGAIVYRDSNSDNSIVVDSSDLYYLADEIDTLESSVKSGIRKSLLAVGTDASGDGTFGELFNAIECSQDIKVTETPAVSRNLSRGTAAWVEGTYVIGDGGDNDAAYQKGYADGRAAVANGQISYVYHEHTGSAADGTGCYTRPVYHTHTGNSTSGGGCYTVSTTTVGCKADAIIDGGPYPDTSYAGYHYNLRCTANPYHDAGQVNGTANQYHYGQVVGRCGDESVTVTTYSLGCNMTTSTRIGWALGCGKTESTIESATIVFP